MEIPWSGLERRKKRKLLYLDDNEDDLMIFETRARAYGFETKTVRYPSDFISEYETGQYDAAFSDFLLTTIDGVSLTRLLHKDKAPNTKLYIFTAFDRNIVRKKVNGDKINGVLDKADGISKALAEVVNGR